jgi:aspartate/methionine/tyrosine aminotransferase
MFRLNDLFGVNLAHTAERLAVVALDNLDPIQRAAKALLAANRVFLERFLDARADLDCYRPGIGTVVFPRLKSGRVEELCRRAREEYETSVVPGRFFGSPEHFRIGISGSTETVAEGLDRLGRALDEVR